MRKATVSLDDEIGRCARIKAVESKTSVSAHVKGFPIKLTTEKSETEPRKRLQNDTLAAIHAGYGFRAADRLSRDELSEVFSEDLAPDRDYDGIQVINSFR